MIKIKNLTAGYHGQPVIRNISMDFIPGEVLVLLGPNGSGKSTFLKTALGLLPAMDGQILYDEVDIRRMTKKQIAQKAAFLTQNRSMPSIQSLKMVLCGRFPYLSYPRQYSRDDFCIARHAMDITGCRQHEAANVSELSGGQQQTVCLAMALAQDTETIFMDEPTAYLDIQRQFQTLENARALAGSGKAVVLVLHDLAMALRCADRIAVFNDGQLLICGTPESVYHSGVLDRIFHVQVHDIQTPHGRQYYCTPQGSSSS